MKQKIIILGGNYASLLGMVRAVGSIGCKVAVIKSYVKKEKKTIEYYSRFIDEYYFIKDADRVGLVNLLLTKCVDKNQKPILIPTNDDTTMTIDLYLDQLKEYFICPAINSTPGAITALMNKSRQKEIARQIGFNVPIGNFITLKKGSYKLNDDIIYPCFTKAEISVLGGKTFMKKCNDKEELKKVLDIASRRWDCNVLIEEYINIEKEYAVVGCSYADEVYIPGVIYLEMQGDGEHKGVAMAGKIEPVRKHSEIVDLIAKFIKEIKYEGLFDVDFYFSNGKYYFNELNLRCGASCFAFTYNNINIPQTMINHYNNIINNNVIVDEEYSFVNEKVCLESYASNYISWNQFQKIIKANAIHAIEYINDLTPWTIFKRKFIFQRMKKMIKRILSYLGLYTFK